MFAVAGCSLYPKSLEAGTLCFFCASKALDVSTGGSPSKGAQSPSVGGGGYRSRRETENRMTHAS